MTLDVLLFAGFRDAADGQPVVTVELTDATATGESVYRALEARFPAFRSLRGVGRLALNLEYRPMDSALSPGDEVALLMPVAGG